MLGKRENFTNLEVFFSDKIPIALGYLRKRKSVRDKG